jgi:hypothetical protein
VAAVDAKGVLDAAPLVGGGSLDEPPPGDGVEVDPPPPRTVGASAIPLAPSVPAEGGVTLP